MAELILPNQLLEIDRSSSRDKQELFTDIMDLLDTHNYTVTETDFAKPWGGYIRLEDTDADRFIGEFFPGTDTLEARLGNSALSLSPKLLLAAPEQRLSWQYHHRRAERWKFMTTANYMVSPTDDETQVVTASPGDILQIQQGERHRLIGAFGEYALVAEIWQHTDPSQPSDEADIIRVQDDYSRG